MMIDSHNLSIMAFVIKLKIKELRKSDETYYCCMEFHFEAGR